MPLLRQYAAATRNGQLLDTLQQIDQSFTYLLKYLADGAADPGRGQLFIRLHRQLSAITSNLIQDTKGEEASTLFDAALRSSRFSNLNFAEVLGRFISADAALQLMEVYEPDGRVREQAKQLLNEKDRAMKDIFNCVWTIRAGDDSQLKSIVNVATDADISYGLRNLIVTALILSIQECYDSQRFSALIDIEQRTTDGRIRAHALVGIIILLAKYKKEAERDCTMKAKFDKWLENPDTEQHLHDAAFVIVKTRGSARMAERVKNEILPGLTDIGKDILKNVKIDSPEISLEELQENPEWERIMQSSGFDKRIRRLNDMQKKGADMMVPMYAQMASNFYFKDIDRWFRSFEIWEAARIGLTRNLTEILAQMPQTPMMCDTDKYILLLNLSHMPSQARDMLTASFRAGEEEIKAEYDELSLHTPEPDFEMELTNYTKVLFRFFTYFRLHKEFTNPFAEALDFTSLPYIGMLFGDEDLLQTIGESYFHQGYYSDAARIYFALCESEELPSPVMLQKLGYCYEKDENYDNALETYLRADSLGDGKDRWLLTRIKEMAVQCHDNLLYADTLDRLLQLDKDDLPSLRAWLESKLRITSTEEGEDDEEIGAKVKNRLGRLKYMAPDDTLTNTLDALYQFRAGHYPEVIEILSPRRSEMELLLGASALGNNSGEIFSSPSDHNAICSDMVIMASAYAALEQYDEAVAVLHGIITLYSSQYNYNQLYADLQTYWNQSPLLSDRLIMIPMLIQAAAPL